jgi:chromodomain-helicase-DNA-binding protein 1
MFWPLDPPPPGSQLESTYNKISNALKESADAGEGQAEPGKVAESAATNGVSAPPTAAIKT